MPHAARIVRRSRARSSRNAPEKVQESRRRLGEGPLRQPRDPLKPGVSGNPSRRANAFEQVRTLAREHSPEAFKTLVELMRLADEPLVRLRAAEQILDRAFGRPAQAVELLGAIAHVDVTALSDAELRAHVSHLREQLQPGPSDAPEPPARLA
jgi:hypothetical protein